MKKKLFTVALIISIIILLMDIITIIYTKLTISDPFLKKLIFRTCEIIR